MTMLTRFVPAEDPLPRGWGVVYRDPEREGCQAMPVPLNMIVRWCQHVWYGMRFPGLTFRSYEVYRFLFDGARREGYEEGYERGLAEGYKRGLRVVAKRSMEGDGGKP